MISKSGMRIMRVLCVEQPTIGQLAQKLQRSASWTSEAVTALEHEGFVERARNGVSTVVRPAPTQHARILHAMMTDVPGIDYEQFLYGKRLLVLWALLYESKSVHELVQTVGMQPWEVRWHLRPLYKRALLWHEKKRYWFAQQGRPLLWSFLDAYRNYTQYRGKVLWKLDKEVLFEALAEIDAMPAGFMGYEQYGVRYGASLHYTWFIPKRKLSIAEIAVQSLAQTSDPRDLAVCITFVLKHRLTYKKMVEFAVKYDCRERLRDLFIVMRSGERRIETERLPRITQREIDETLNVYKVKRYVPEAPA